MRFCCFAILNYIPKPNTKAVFSSDRNIETIGQLFVELKRYVELKGKCMQIDFVSKLSRLMAALVVTSVLFILGGIALLFISMMLAAAIAPHVGGLAYSYAIIVALYALLAMLVYAKRQAWIEAPITNFLGHLFLDETTPDSMGNDSANPPTPNQHTK